MTSTDFAFDPALLHPLPGRIVLELAKHDDKIGSIVVPEIARDHTQDDIALPATVLAVGYGPFWERSDLGSAKIRKFPGVTPEDVKAGDRVYVSALLKDLNKRFVVTSVTRIEAVVD